MGEIMPGEYPKDAAVRVAQDMLALDVALTISDEGFPVGDAEIFLVDGSAVNLINMAPNDEIADWSWEQRPEEMRAAEFFGFPRAKPGNKERLHSKDSIETHLNFVEGQLEDALKSGNPEKIAQARQQLKTAHEEVVDFLAQSDVSGLPADMKPGDVGAKVNETDILPMVGIDAATGTLRNGKDQTARVAFINGDKILVSKQKSGDSLLPGGHAKGEETAKDTALREATEETGLDTEFVNSLLTGDSYTVSDDKIDSVVFIADASGLNLEDFTPKDDVAEFSWGDMPFTDSYGHVHPKGKENAKEAVPNIEGITEDVDGVEESPAERKNYITHDDGKWTVHSEEGKHLGTYDSEDEAKKRLAQVEAFKHMDNSAGDISCLECKHDWDSHNGECMPCGAPNCECQEIVLV